MSWLPVCLPAAVPSPHSLSMSPRVSSLHLLPLLHEQHTLPPPVPCVSSKSFNKTHYKAFFITTQQKDKNTEKKNKPNHLSTKSLSNQLTLCKDPAWPPAAGYRARSLPGLGPLTETHHVLEDGKRGFWALRGLRIQMSHYSLISTLSSKTIYTKANAPARSETLQRRNELFSLVLSWNDHHTE